MSIAPIVSSVTVAVPPERAFALFTQKIGRWWMPGRHIGTAPMVDVVIEPVVGGRWYERDEDGSECDWGKVLAWDPPGRVLLAWLIDASFTANPDCRTEVEVTFVASGEGTRVTLTHARLEAFGPSAEAVRAKLSGGWPTLVQLFADFTREQSQ